MARSRSRGAGARKTADRQTRATSRKRSTAATADAEVVEEAPGMGMEAGLAIITSIALLVACLFLDYELGTSYGSGVFF